MVWMLQPTQVLFGGIIYSIIQYETHVDIFINSGTDGTNLMPKTVQCLM